MKTHGCLVSAAHPVAVRVDPPPGSTPGQPSPPPPVAPSDSQAGPMNAIMLLASQGLPPRIAPDCPPLGVQPLARPSAAEGQERQPSTALARRGYPPPPPSSPTSQSPAIEWKVLPAPDASWRTDSQVLELVFDVVADRGPEESARVALTSLGEQFVRDLAAQGREVAEPARLDVRYFRRSAGQWESCRPEEASRGTACIRVRTRLVGHEPQPSLGSRAIHL